MFGYAGLQQAPVGFEQYDESLSSPPQQELEAKIDKPAPFYRRNNPFRTLKPSSHPPHYYQNVVALILYMLPKIREIVLTTDCMPDLQKTFNKLHEPDYTKPAGCHSFWGLIGYPQKGYPRSRSTFHNVLGKLPQELKTYCEIIAQNANFPGTQRTPIATIKGKQYLFVPLGAAGRTDQFKEPEFMIEIDTKSEIKDDDKNILRDILYSWMDHNQNMMNQFRDFMKIIIGYAGCVDNKLYYELVSVVMARNVDVRFGNGHEYWTFCKDSKYECCTTDNLNSWYKFRQREETKCVTELTVKENLNKKDVKKGIPYFVVYSRLNAFSLV